ncbi:hypothetical protein [Fibrobacter sp.]|uniref:hypothetical protein n=1 Tax=Fibrobacter sp. TaxID=35828 RepID=UPI0025BBAF9B|nr:hypothetical protein [Fibrobacter sp.]MBR3073598.1 hypothetical protein [Fibrobacter sp.]
MNKTQIFLLVSIFSALSFLVGHKIGDARGYEDGYNEGYRYDCKEEIAAIYKQVKAQSKALEYTDSTIKKVMHVNDSLMHKEYFQKRYNDSLRQAKIDSQNVVRYGSFAKRYNDSIARFLGEKYPTNFILEDGRVNVLMCMSPSSPYANLKECDCWRKNSKKSDVMKFGQAIGECDGYARNRFDSMKKNRKKGRK